MDVLAVVHIVVRTMQYDHNIVDHWKTTDYDTGCNLNEEHYDHRAKNAGNVQVQEYCIRDLDRGTY